MELLWLASGTIIIGVFGCVAWFWGSNMILDAVYPPRGAAAGRNIRRAGQIRPWLFLGPAILFLSLYLVYPVLDSLWRSLNNANGSRFVGFSNYTWLAGDSKFRESMLNNLLWLLVVPALSTLFGLIAAQLTDRIRWGNIGKSLIFMPMAISFVGAGVIWKFIYEYRGPDEVQIGLLNWIVTKLGGDPQIWLTLIPWNNLLLMIVLVWIQTGFAMVILSAALRGIPEETIEAAILDGASPMQVFMKIKVPQIMGTIAVVWTTITIVVLKVFDIVFVMTNGQWGTQVLANLMYDWTFRASDYGRGSAVAMILMVLVTPIMVWNIRNARREVR
ncbi:MAG: carbohydrate ABC transporter permease [Paracoccus sp. (in: a-proteobacteria)]|jgi:alpha-glucoside transport system permease protein|uniref:carbohydrate ABC transporter permease n=1 Tax=unclassified Paracoccus (in: a-proteobacteria) TaxID=2688777 RepID=UPI000C67ABF3|nr:MULTISPECIES: sugar ABC transporter permease [unclassified Paracoccus (in: a-proteobacteria)]MAN10973.1 alpha-glucoside ABC transporter permease [Sphingobium sp.]MAN57906.1 alpha-glucoside ABC transporter permease [Paracoccus sp. (in: a-proteobacteria)]MBA47437.1 alpha-glucoside ABC transporter permease [Paracoccus sp. (in: a-proteobacteria)]MDB2552447.1 sugar ABC transporter permease [Paracoccus sp. (in: a-proteobacteria)]HIC65798.1 sugar ABC transporter permease [Paracoccus sp. (in: a-pro|tara:strand:+ start:545 stop:1537 length:993 start_codon:yes stop_codon:yes gene_type:complete